MKRGGKIGLSALVNRIALVLLGQKVSPAVGPHCKQMLRAPCKMRAIRSRSLPVTIRKTSSANPMA